MAKCACWLITVIGVAIGIVAVVAILTPILVIYTNETTTVTNNAKTTTTVTSNAATTTVTSNAATTTITSNAATTWPTMNAIPFGFSSWKVIIEVDINMSSVNAKDQILDMNVTDGSVWVKSYGTSFSIDVVMTLLSPQFAYFYATPVGNPIYMTLTPDLVHSNDQCILRINTYSDGTVVDVPSYPTADPIYALVLILSIYHYSIFKYFWTHTSPKIIKNFVTVIVLYFFGKLL